MEIKRMPKPKEDLGFTPPREDPYILMKQQYEFLLQRLDSIEQQVANLQTTWDRILNVAQEPPLRQPYQQQHQQPYNPYTQPSYGQVGGQEPAPVKDTRPRWEIDKEKEVKEPKKQRPSKRLILIFAVIVIVLIVYMYLKSKGYSITIPGL